MTSPLDLRETVAVVTGSSRGIGKGIALALGARGATVYVTGRTTEPGQNPLPGTIHETAAEIIAAGGTGIAVACDHGDDDQVAALFDRVRDDHDHLDLQVNNVTTLPTEIMDPPPFWTKPLRLADQISVGLRSAYVATYFAAPLLVAGTTPLVVNISYYGAVSYHLDPAYGATKAGLDKMTFDMASDFAEYGVTVISLWPGMTATEFATAALARIPGGTEMLAYFETPNFTGRVVGDLYTDPDTRNLSGTVVIGAEYAHTHGITDHHGATPPSHRDTHGAPRPFFTKP